MSRRRVRNYSMPTSLVRSFTDPDEFAAAIRAAKVEIAVTGRGNFAAKVVRVDLHRLWLQRFDDNLPRLAHTVAAKGRAIITFGAAGETEQFRNGRPMPL